MREVGAEPSACCTRWSIATCSGPGLGVRILGEGDRRHAAEADHFIEELRSAGWYDKTWQALRGSCW